MVKKQASRGIPREALRDGLRLQEIDALLRAHGASIRSVDNHHWQISRGEHSGLWLLGDGAARSGGGVDPSAIERLQRVLHSTGLLCERDLAPPPSAAMAAATRIPAVPTSAATRRTLRALRRRSRPYWIPRRSRPAAARR